MGETVDSPIGDGQAGKVDFEGQHRSIGREFEQRTLALGGHKGPDGPVFVEDH